MKIISADGSVRDAMSDGFLYEGEQIISTDENALFQIKYLAWSLQLKTAEVILKIQIESLRMDIEKMLNR